MKSSVNNSIDEESSSQNDTPRETGREEEVKQNQMQVLQKSIIQLGKQLETQKKSYEFEMEQLRQQNELFEKETQRLMEIEEQCGK